MIKTLQHQPSLRERLSIIETHIGNLQEEMSDIQALRAGIRWRENGEKSAGFLKRLNIQRANKRSIQELRHPDTNEVCDRPETMQRAASRYYEVPYTPSQVDNEHTQYFTNQIPITDRISDASHTILCSPFHSIDLLSSMSRSPKKSSPGMDGLPYEILAVLLMRLLRNWLCRSTMRLWN